MRTPSRNRYFWRISFALLLLLRAPLSLLASDAETVAALEAAGGQIKKDKSGVPSEVFFKDSSAITIEQWKQIGSLKSLRKGTFYNKCTLNDETLPLLSGLENLEEFAVDGAHLTDKGMQGFAVWKKLKRITFFHVFWGQKNFDGSGLDVFASLPALESFGMGGSTLTDAGMASLSKVTQLKELNLWHTNITDAGTAHVRALTQLRKLRLAPQFNGKLNDAMIANAAALPLLEKLSLGETRLTYVGGLKLLKQIPALKEFELDRIDLSDEDLTKLKADLPNVVFKHTKPSEKEIESLNRVGKGK